MTFPNEIRARILILAGTTEARLLAERLSNDARFNVTVSFAGRVERPALPPVAVRIGGFGGIDGLATYLRDHAIDVVIDATHPFAAQMSTNATAACAAARVSLLALERPPWVPLASDRWQHFANVASAIQALPAEPKCVFSGLGRLSAHELAAAPQHRYVIRLIDKPTRDPALANVTYIFARGPFRDCDDIALFKNERVDIVLAKNAGGTAAYAKIAAARTLALPVFMIDRPKLPHRQTFETVEAVHDALSSHLHTTADRGV